MLDMSFTLVVIYYVKLWSNNLYCFIAIEVDSITSHHIHPSSQWHLFEQRHSLKWKLCHMSRCNVIALDWITSQASHHKQDTTWRWQREKPQESMKFQTICEVFNVIYVRWVLHSAVFSNKLRMILLVNVWDSSNHWFVVCRRQTLISHNYCQFKQSTS